MSLFQHFNTRHEMPSLFHILDDYDRAFRGANSHLSQRSSAFKGFAPKFDVKELNDSYELHGELPGIDQKDISIEWTDGNTLTISGRTERHREEGTRPGAIEDVSNSEKDADNHYHKPTVEDDATETSTAGAATPATSVAGAVTKAGDTQAVTKSDGAKYWVSERSVGEFHRAFSFPARVDQEAVKASLKDGILSIVVPKARAPLPRKINIQ